MSSFVGLRLCCALRCVVSCGVVVWDIFALRVISCCIVGRGVVCCTLLGYVCVILCCIASSMHYAV